LPEKAENENGEKQKCQDKTEQDQQASERGQEEDLDHAGQECREA
jgi:hypothetical protein